MKRSELIFAAVRVPTDATMIVLSALAAYAIRISPSVTVWRPVAFTIDVPELVRVSLLVSALWVLVFAVNGLYAIRRYPIREEIGRVILAVSTGMMLVFTVIFFFQQIFESRFIVLVAWALSMAFIVASRLLLRLFERILLSRGIGQHKVVLLGPEKTRAILQSAFRERPSLGFKVVDTFSEFNLETRKALIHRRSSTGVDIIVLTDPDMSRESALRLLRFTEEAHISFFYTADLFQASMAKLRAHTLAGLPLFEVRKTPLEGWGAIYKRVFDLAGSLFLIILTSPIMLAEVIAIKLDSKGPVFFSKLDDGDITQRIGKHGKPFRYFKFRSMYDKVHNRRYEELASQNTRNGPLVKIENDPRITRVGRIIRRASLDEFAEFFLVFAGKMSLVGPRPHLPEEVAKYRPEWRKVFTIKPGITGLAQISGRADLDFEDEVRLDTYYIEHWSPWLDFLILLKTPWVVLTGKGAK
ncbi:MAG: sugar transferase [Patescibacteria group bacterium]